MASLILTGCVRTATLVDFHTGETLQATFTDASRSKGNIKITMPDG